MKKNIILIILLIILIGLIIIELLKKNQLERFNNNEDETSCTYVSSHGIKKACANIDNCTYIKSDHLHSFNIPETPFILVTGDEDTTIPDDSREKANSILNSPNLIHWYSQNLNYLANTKLSSIPIGLDYHTLANGKYDSWGKQESSKKQEDFILRLEKKPFEQRELKLYINFNNSIHGKYGKKDRKDALEQIPKNLQFIEQKSILRNETWENMCKYSFVVSPHGNGLDCHRTWEALVLGCIPVVKASSLNILYENLPVLIVNNWYDVNEELLKNTIEEFKIKTFNYEKLKLEYWINKIKNS
jgi:hypothetical protein